MYRYYRRILVVVICALLFFSQIALYVWNQIDLERPAKPKVEEEVESDPEASLPLLKSELDHVRMSAILGTVCQDRE